MDSNSTVNGFDLEKGQYQNDTGENQTNDIAIIQPDGTDSNYGSNTERKDGSSNRNNSNNSTDHYRNTGKNNGYQSILGEKFCCFFKISETVRKKLIIILAILSGLFTISVVFGLIYYADQVNGNYFPSGLAYAVYAAIIFSGLIGPILSFLLSTVFLFNKRNISEMSPILTNSNYNNSNINSNNVNIKLCCCRKIMIEFYPIKNLRTLIGTYLLGTIIPVLIIFLQIINFHN